MAQGAFITSTGTSAGKTFITRGLARALVEQGGRVAALKPLETGCDPAPLDALALASAACSEALIAEEHFYRTSPPVCPLAATLCGHPAPDMEGIVAGIRSAAGRYQYVLVEGAGGLLVPLDERSDIADLARTLAYPLVLVAPNRLGVLSHVLTAAEAARTRGLPIAALVLSEPDSAPDASTPTNAQILRGRLPIPVLTFPNCSNENDALAAAVRDCGLLRALGWDS